MPSFVILSSHGARVCWFFRSFLAGSGAAMPCDLGYRFAPAATDSTARRCVHGKHVAGRLDGS